MVGSGGGGGGERSSREAVGMMAVHEALRSVCLNSDWTYSVFWTIRPRPRVRGGNGCKVGDDNGSLMFMWEDGFCRGRVGECLQDEIDSADPVRKAFSKMSIQLYNYGEGWVLVAPLCLTYTGGDKNCDNIVYTSSYNSLEGFKLMGKVASDKCHKWVFKEPSENEPNISNYWQSSFDALPTEWTDQFESGIQTIAVIQAGHGLLQLGSCKIIPEDLHFVLRMRHTFESLGYQSGVYLSQLFSSTRNTSSSPALPLKQPGPSPLFNWGPRPLPLPSSMLGPPYFLRPLGYPPAKDETNMLMMPHSGENRMDEMMGEHGTDIKWPNGLSFFSALTGNMGPKPDPNHLAFIPDGKAPNPNLEGPNLNLQGLGGANPNEFLSLDNHQDQMRKSIQNKFTRRFTLSGRMASPASSTSLDHHPPEAGMYSDVMETYLE